MHGIQAITGRSFAVIRDGERSPRLTICPSRVRLRLLWAPRCIPSPSGYITDRSLLSPPKSGVIAMQACGAGSPAGTDGRKCFLIATKNAWPNRLPASIGSCEETPIPGDCAQPQRLVDESGLHCSPCLNL